MLTGKSYYFLNYKNIDSNNVYFKIFKERGLIHVIYAIVIGFMLFPFVFNILKMS